MPLHAARRTRARVPDGTGDAPVRGHRPEGPAAHLPDPGGRARRPPDGPGLTAGLRVLLAVPLEPLRGAVRGWRGVVLRAVGRRLGLRRRRGRVGRRRLDAAAVLVAAAAG